MKINQVITKFREYRSYRCPICHFALSLTEQGSFLCENRHCFDLSSKGYVNFIPGQSRKKMKYDKHLFENRKKVFLDGFYKKILEEIADQSWKQIAGRKGKKGVLLDAGCGEGYYLQNLSKHEKLKESSFLGIDIVKDAIIMACGENSPVQWMVANINHLPIKNKSVDVLLNILTLADYEEFTRVLKDDGILIKVIPGKHYLQEIRESAAEQLEHKTHSNEAVMEYLNQQMDIVERKEIYYQLPVTLEQAACFLKMTPMTFGVDTNLMNHSNLHTITIHLEILTAKKRKCSHFEDQGTQE